MRLTPALALVALAACGGSHGRSDSLGEVSAGGVRFPVRTTGVRLGLTEVSVFAADAGDACNPTGLASTTHLVRVRVFGPPPGHYPVQSVAGALLHAPGEPRVATAQVVVMEGDDVLAAGVSGDVTLGEMSDRGLAASVHAVLDDGSRIDLDVVAAGCS